LLILVVINQVIHYSGIHAFGISFFEKQNSLNYQMYHSIGKAQQAKFAKSCGHNIQRSFSYLKFRRCVERTNTLIETTIGLDPNTGG
jgi:hypothetical protein